MKEHVLAQGEGSVHSLRALGLQAIPPPVPGHAPSFAPLMNGGPQSRPASRGPAMMGAQKSLPPTPALTPAMQHRQTGVTPAMAIQSAMVGNSMMQQGMAVGPGEIPNGAGPFVNGGLHNTSDDSIMMGSSASNRVNLRPEADMESLASRGQPGSFQQQPQQLAPLGRPQGKLTPGRMSGRGAPSPGPQSAGQRAPAAGGQGGGQPAGGQQQRPAAPQQARQRPESRAGRHQRRGHDPATHLNRLNHSLGETDTL